jgi:dienelactone hydrolase
LHTIQPLYYKQARPKSYSTTIWFHIIDDKRSKKAAMEQDTLRQTLIAHLGHFPARVPLELKLENTVEEEGYTQAQVSYLVEANERIVAWLLTPHSTPPPHGWPAILAIHQHAGQYDLGKSEPAGLLGNPQYAYGLELCRRGYVVLCPDQLCFEDRRPSQERRQANPSLEGGGYERFEATRLLLSGSCLQTKYLHDLTCALDVLTSLPTVNTSRIGAIGHSLGGQETLWLSWYDARVAAAVSSCGFSLLQAIVRDGINHNLAAYVPGMLEIGDMDALVTSLAPRPFMLTAGETDAIFPIDGVRTLVNKAQEAYTQAGASEHFRAHIFPAGHSFPDDVKIDAYTFLDRWLKEAP